MSGLARNAVRYETEYARKRLADSQAQMDAPFEYAERLSALARRQQEIEDELHLTKNQASARLGEDDTIDG